MNLSTPYLRPLLIAVASMLVIWSFVDPVYESPDEPYHWAVARYIHDHGALPKFSAEYFEATQPPLYYLLMAPFAANMQWIDLKPTFDTLGAPNSCCTVYRTYPVRASDVLHFRFAPVRIARLVTAFFTLFTIYFIYLAALEASGQPATALLAGAVAGFLPQLTFRGSSVNNDALVAAVCAACLFFSVRIYISGFTWKRAYWAAGLLGAAFLSKTSGAALTPAVAVALVAATAPSWKVRLTRLAALGVTALVILPWLIWNLVNYGDLLAIAVPNAFWKVITRPLSDPYFLHEFPDSMWKSFLGLFGMFAIRMPSPYYIFFDVVFLLGGIGVLVAAFRRKLNWILALLLTLPILANIVLAILYNIHYTQPQGRFLFPSLCCFALLIAIGLRSLVTDPRVAAGFAILFLAVNIIVVFGVLYPVYWSSANEGMWTDISVSLAKGITPAGPLTPDYQVKQSFVAREDRMCSLVVWIANYGLHLTAGQLELRLVSGADPNAVLARKSIPVRGQQDNVWVEFPFPEIKESKGRTYSVILSAEGMPPGQAITPWLTGVKTYPAGTLWVGGQEQPKDLVMRTYFHEPE
jgi:hypothetical protein